MRLSEDDQAFMAWATKRHTWLWRRAFPGRVPPKGWSSRASAAMALHAAIALMRFDRMAWKLLR